MTMLSAMRSARALVSRPARQPIPMDRLLVWTYRDQRADVVIGRGVGLHGLEAAADGVTIQASSACGCAAVARIAELGVRVDSLGRDRGDLHPDAELVHRAVIKLGGKVAGLPVAHLVIRCASRGEVPDAMVGERPQARPYLHAVNGSVRVDGKDANGRYGWCPISWSPSWSEIVAARDEYGVWLSAVRALAFALASEPRLMRWHPLPPEAPAEPWFRA